MLNNKISAIKEQFKKECTIIELRYEYPNYTGNERYAIVTELTQSEIEIKYCELMSEYAPYVVLSKSYLSVREEYIRNEDKARKRMKNNHDSFGYEDGEMELRHAELALQDFSNDFIESTYLKELLEMLPEQQYRRIVQYYFDSKSIVEIAKLEGVSHQTVSKSIKAGLKFLKKIWTRGCI